MNPYTSSIREIIRRGFSNPRFMQWAIHEKGKELKRTHIPKDIIAIVEAQS